GLRLHCPWGGAAVHYAPPVEVDGSVLGDHVRLVRRLVQPVRRVGREDLRVPFDPQDIGVLGDAPDARAVVTMNRIVRTRPCPRVVRVALPEGAVEDVDDGLLGRRHPPILPHAGEGACRQAGGSDVAAMISSSTDWSGSGGGSVSGKPRTMSKACAMRSPSMTGVWQPAIVVMPRSCDVST